jgi:lysophosphatidate acyltransferase
MANVTQTVLAPIETKDLTAADVDSLTQSTRDSMLKNIVAMARPEETKVDASHANGVSTAIQI